MLSRDKCHEEKEGKGVVSKRGTILMKWQFEGLKYRRKVE